MQSGSTLWLWSYASARSLRVRQHRLVERFPGLSHRTYPWGIAMRPPAGPQGLEALHRLSVVGEGSTALVVVRENADAGDPWAAVSSWRRVMALANDGEAWFDRRAWLPWAQAGGVDVSVETWVAREAPGVTFAVMSLARLRAFGHSTVLALVGREHERTDLDVRLDRLIRLGSRETLVISGAAGMGKSALLGALTASASARGVQVVQVAIHPREVDPPGAAFRRWTEALLEALEVPVDDRQDWIDGIPAFDPLRLWVGEVCDLRLGREERLALGQRSRAARTDQRALALASLVGRVAERAPLCMIVEDLHWASEDMLELLRCLERADGTPRLMVMTTRPEEDPTASGGWRELAHLRLHPLPREGARQLALAFARQFRSPWLVAAPEYLTDAAIAACVERAAGHPLFLMQLLHQAAHGGERPASGDLTTLLVSRLDALDPEVRALLEAAACLGPRFRAERFVGFDPVPDLLFDQAAREGILERDGSAWRFAHALLRDELVRRLAPDRLVALHGALAKTAPAASLERAHHLACAGDPRAPEALLTLGLARAAAGSTSEALDLLQRGAGCATDPSDAVALACAMGALYLGLGDGTASLAAYRRASAVAQQPQDALRAALGALGALRLLGRVQDLQDAIDDLRARVVATGSPADRAALSYFQGCVCFARGDVDGCEAAHRAAIDQVRGLDPGRTLADAWSGLGDARYARGDYVGAMDAFDRCIALAVEIGHARAEVGARHMAAMLCAYLGRVPEALTRGEQGYTLATHAGDARAAYFATTNLALCLYVAGRWDEAGATFAEALERAQGIGSGLIVGMGRAFAAHVERSRGDVAGALALSEQGIGAAREHGPAYFGGVAVGARLRCLTDPAGLSALVDLGLDWCPSSAISHNPLYFAMGALVAADRWSDGEVAGRVHRMLENGRLGGREIALVRHLSGWCEALATSGGHLPPEARSRRVKAARDDGLVMVAALLVEATT